MSKTENVKPEDFIAITEVHYEAERVQTMDELFIPGTSPCSRAPFKILAVNAPFLICLNLFSDYKSPKRSNFSFMEDKVIPFDSRFIKWTKLSKDYVKSYVSGLMGDEAWDNLSQEKKGTGGCPFCGVKMEDVKLGTEGYALECSDCKVRVVKI